MSDERDTDGIVEIIKSQARINEHLSGKVFELLDRVYFLERKLEEVNDRVKWLQEMKA